MKDALIRLLLLTNVALLIVAAAPKQQPKTLTVTELAVVDANGVVRARIGGDLPDAVVKGKRIRRGQKAAGVMLYDASGQERGGYITFSPGDQVALTLDGRERQSALFVADADGTTALKIWHPGGRLELRADDAGPSIHAMRGKTVAFHAPEPVGFEKSEGCAELRAALKTAPRADVLDACRERMPDDACRACLGDQ